MAFAAKVRVLHEPFLSPCILDADKFPQWAVSLSLK